MSTYDSGKLFINHLYALIKSIQVYDVNNDVVQTNVQRLFNHMQTVFTLYARLELVRYRDYIFFNKQRMRFEIEGYASLQFIHTKLKTFQIKSMTFVQGITKPELVYFCQLFKKLPNEFAKVLNQKNMPNVFIELSSGDEEIPDFLKDDARVKRSYFKALKVTKNLMQNLWVNRPVDVRQSRRIVYNLIDSISRDEFGILALTAIKNFDEYTYNHSLNVGILSLAVGQRIGLDKKDLADIGTAGLLHDIGKVSIPKELIYKPSKLSDNEWEILKLHSDYGVKQILRTRGLDDTGLVSMTVAYQHHWNFDGSGYPKHDERDRPVLFSRIVRMCDSYDAMTTPRVYQPIPYPPFVALRVLWKLRTTCFDPLLTKVFMQLLGLYPVGTCMILQNDTVALVIRQNEGQPEKPVIKIVRDTKGGTIDGEIIDLSANGKASIKQLVFAQKYGINPASYFV
ncbi:HD domain-containing protein [candidate division WOR-3 bacterium]|nr:HD domain-containing protein [candidate division WOR-3 bacterium]